MEKFCIQFQQVIDEDLSYFEFNGFDAGLVDRDSTHYERYCFNQIQEIQQIILSDFQKALDYRICHFKNHEALRNEIQILLDTYNNGVYSALDIHNFCYPDIINFIVLTDHYLCFNNLEEVVDMDYVTTLWDEAIVSETLIIVDRAFKNFYFVHSDTKVINESRKTYIQSFHIQDDTVLSYQTNFKEKFRVLGYTEDDILNMIGRIEKNQKRYLKK